MLKVVLKYDLMDDDDDGENGGVDDDEEEMLMLRLTVFEANCLLVLLKQSHLVSCGFAYVRLKQLLYCILYYKRYIEMVFYDHEF